MLIRAFNRKWLLTTCLVILAMGVLVRLGMWQLDRLEARRAFNARVQAQIDREALVLNRETLGSDLVNMEYRKVMVQGVYDYANEVALRNQAYENQWGVHLITPLIIEGTQIAVMIDRGWIPAEDYQSGDWSKFSEPGVVEVRGILRRSQDKPDFGNRRDEAPKPGSGRLTTWNFVNVEGISHQTPYPLLPVYIQKAPENGDNGLPIPGLPKLELTEGPHLGYALQWFTFAAILGFGYPVFIRRQEGREQPSRPQTEGSTSGILTNQ